MTSWWEVRHNVPHTKEDGPHSEWVFCRWAGDYEDSGFCIKDDLSGFSVVPAAKLGRIIKEIVSAESPIAMILLEILDNEEL